MMEYRRLPHGDQRIGTLGLGMGCIQTAPQDEIEAVVREAVNHGINFFDLCAGGAAVYAPFGRAIAGVRDKVYFQLHFGAVYKPSGEYGWSRNLERIKSTFEWELELLGTDHVDFGFLHCVDEMNDINDIIKGGILDYARSLKEAGVVRHLGFSSHTPAVSNRLIDMGLFDMIMFSTNPAYDLGLGDEYGIGTVEERTELFRRCEVEGIGISVMKPFHGGQLLLAETSPFRTEMTKNQCLQYALDRPAVLCVVPGVRGLDDLHALLPFLSSTREENDYSLIGSFTPESAVGRCVYCNHCQPCPAGLDIGLINKYYDLSLAGDKMAHNHYSKLSVTAEACTSCGHCERRCPFGVSQPSRMKAIAEYFKK